MAQGPKQGGDDNTIALVLIIIGGLMFAGFALAAFYGHNRGGVNAIIYVVTKIQTLAFLPFSDRVSQVWNFMNSHDPSTVTWAQASALLDFGGTYGRWIVFPFMVMIGFIAYKGIFKVDKYKRRFNMKKLLVHNAHIYPSLRPVAFRKRMVSEEPTGHGPWRVMESPMLFAMRNGIIKDSSGNICHEKMCFTKDGMPKQSASFPSGGFKFDMNKALEVYRDRMGPKMSESMTKFVKEQPRYIRGLAGAFCAVALGNRDAGQAIFDAMSDSYNEDVAIASWDDRERACDFDIDIRDADEWIIRAFRERNDDESAVEDDLARSIQNKTSKHNYWLYQWLGELLVSARLQGGSIPPQEFIWLRPSNRQMWYFIDPLGGDTAPSEGAGAWSHRLAEKVLKRPIPDPQVENAAKALREGIDAEGWFDNE